MLDDELGEKKKSPGEKAKNVRIVWRETEWRKQVFGLSDPQPYISKIAFCHNMMRCICPHRSQLFYSLGATVMISVTHADAFPHRNRMLDFKLHVV